MSVSSRILGNENSVMCELAGEVLRSSGTLRLRVTGWSMLPAIWPGDTLIVEHIHHSAISEGDIVLFSSGRRLVAHRVVKTNGSRKDSRIQTQGDAELRPDSPVAGNDLLGRV